MSVLSVMVMEALSRMMVATADKGLLSCFALGLMKNEESLVSYDSYLIFADGSLIFGDANSEQIRHMHCIFLCFEAILGLRFNLAKSEIVPVGEVGDREELANILIVEYLHCH